MCEHVMMLQILLLCVKLMKIMENTHLFESSSIHINRGPQTLVTHMHISCKQGNIFATIYDHKCYILCIVLAK